MLQRLGYWGDDDSGLPDPVSFHYVTVHDVRLPETFVEHVRSFTDEIETAEVDDSWWRSLAE